MSVKFVQYSFVPVKAHTYTVFYISKQMYLFTPHPHSIFFVVFHRQKI